MASNISAAESDVQRILDQAVLEGRETAVQVAVYWKGALVIDAWSAPSGMSVDGNTLFPFFSTGKGIAATAVHRLVQRGVLSWDDPIAKHWPEFAAAGKDRITLRHALNHTAGLPMMPETDQIVAADDWDGMCAYLAAASPLHPPGAHRHYHAITYSWLVGEPARRADGRDFRRIINEEVLEPLGIDTLFFGLPEETELMCLDAEKETPLPSPEPQAATPPDPVAQRAIPSWVQPLEDWINRDDVRRACIPASNGFGNARGIARHYAALTGKGVDGVRLLDEATVAAATCWDPVKDVAVPGDGRWALGYALQGPDQSPGERFGHGGYGGSMGFVDQRYELAVAVVKNRMGGDLTPRLIESIYRELDLSE